MVDGEMDDEMVSEKYLSSPSTISPDGLDCCFTNNTLTPLLQNIPIRNQSPNSKRWW